MIKHPLHIVFLRSLLFGLLLLTFGSSVLSKERGSLTYIPVIFHVVYHEESENVSDAQIQSQLNSLNRDFQARNPDIVDVIDAFQETVSDVGLAFVLANRIEQFTLEPIIRVNTTRQVFANADLFDSDKGGSSPIRSDEILNVWVANLTEGLLGFFDEKGVAVDYTSFGTNGTAAAPYNLGRTLTHEIGHFLSLDHPWGLGGCDSDDGIADTPLQTAPTAGCDIASISCGSLDMTQNFMNTSTDDCLLFFTQEQSKKMLDHIHQNLPAMVFTDVKLVLSNRSNVNKTILYPNPSSDGTFFIQQQSVGLLAIKIYSSGGKHIRTYQSEGKKLLLNDLSAGTYFVHVEGSKSLDRFKIIIE